MARLRGHRPPARQDGPVPLVPLRPPVEHDCARLQRGRRQTQPRVLGQRPTQDQAPQDQDRRRGEEGLPQFPDGQPMLLVHLPGLGPGRVHVVLQLKDTDQLFSGDGKGNMWTKQGYNTALGRKGGNERKRLGHIRDTESISFRHQCREVVIRDPLRVGFFESGPNLRYSEYLISDSPLRGLSIHLYGR